MKDNENIVYKIKNLSSYLNNKLNEIEIENKWKNISIIISIWIYIIIVFSAIHSWEKFYIYGIHFDFFVYDINFLITRVVYLLKFIFILCILYISKYLGNNKVDFALKFLYLFFGTIFLGMGIFKKDYTIKYSFPLYINNIYFLFAYIYFLYNLFSKMELKKKSKYLKWMLMISLIIFVITEILYTFQYIYVPKTEYALLKEENKEKIILFKANDKIFLADFEINDKGTKDEKDDVCTIYTKSYEIRKYEDIKVENKTFADVIIDKENTKEKVKELEDEKNSITTETATEITEQTTKEIEKEVIKNE